jgi:hypothetical protein
MAYVRAKRTKRTSRKRQSGAGSYPAEQEHYTYYQLVRGYRDENGKVKQEVLASLGRHPTVEDALTEWQRRAEMYEASAADYRRAAGLLRSGALQGLRTSWSTVCYLAPRVGTDFDPDDAPTPRGFAPRGWFYVKAQTVGKGRESAVEYAEREAAEYAAKASDYRERLERLQSVVTEAE